MILEKKNKIQLSLPRVLADVKLSPRVKHPMPNTSGFALGIVGSAGSGKTSTLVSLIKSKDVYRKRFHNIITVIPSSSLDSLQSNPFKDLDPGHMLGSVYFLHSLYFPPSQTASFAKPSIISFLHSVHFAFNTFCMLYFSAFGLFSIF